jgi:predicted GIY-YIG superfamily endonuclease
MIGNRGIDQDVQAKMDAFRGNPQALAQKYSQSQQLIDLLALQKLKSEKEAAAREMQMKMGGQQMPTIADAREKEVLDLTKQELAQQTTGAMRTQQSQQQQAAKDLVERTAQMPKQSMSPMVQGVAGLQAPNMSTKAMAAGGIVAFQEGGRAEDEVDPALNEEMMRFIESQRQAPERREPARQSEMAALARQGIRNLIGTRTPDETFRQRTEEATRAIDYTPEERAIMQRQIADRAAMDESRYNPERTRSEALTRWLLGAGGRTGIGSVLGGAGAAAANYQDAMQREARNALVNRQKQEAGIVDVSPAARMAGMKLGSEAERTAMTGLAQGVGDAVRLEQLAAQAAARGNPEEAKRLTAAANHVSRDPYLREGSKLLTRLVEAGRTDDPIYNQTLRDMEVRQNQIYKLYKIDSPEIPMPSQSAPVAPPASNRSMWLPDIGRIFGSGTPPAQQPRVVPFSSIPRE